MLWGGFSQTFLVSLSIEENWARGKRHVLQPRKRYLWCRGKRGPCFPQLKGPGAYRCERNQEAWLRGYSKAVGLVRVPCPRQDRELAECQIWEDLWARLDLEISPLGRWLLADDQQGLLHTLALESLCDSMEVTQVKLPTCPLGSCFIDNKERRHFFEGRHLPVQKSFAQMDIFFLRLYYNPVCPLPKQTNKKPLNKRKVFR